MNCSPGDGMVSLGLAESASRGPAGAHTHLQLRLFVTLFDVQLVQLLVEALPHGRDSPLGWALTSTLHNVLRGDRGGGVSLVTAWARRDGHIDTQRCLSTHTRNPPVHKHASSHTHATVSDLHATLIHVRKVSPLPDLMHIPKLVATGGKMKQMYMSHHLHHSSLSTILN